MFTSFYTNKNNCSDDCQVFQGFTLLYPDLDFHAVKTDGSPVIKMLLQKPKGDIIDDISYNVRHYSSQVNTVSFIQDCKFKGESRATF